ncbi:MAG: hypothetical protein OER86_09195, partial [Phycisphaerae bacterium]|nr:hypothetical protein [Phycisphaerae bacterium]
ARSSDLPVGWKLLEVLLDRPEVLGIVGHECSYVGGGMISVRNPYQSQTDHLVEHEFGVERSRRWFLGPSSMGEESENNGENQNSEHGRPRGVGKEILFAGSAYIAFQ